MTLPMPVAIPANIVNPKAIQISLIVPEQVCLEGVSHGSQADKSRFCSHPGFSPFLTVPFPKDFHPKYFFEVKGYEEPYGLSIVFLPSIPMIPEGRFCLTRMALFLRVTRYLRTPVPYCERSGSRP
jgi:hypothetical protein